MSNEERSEWSPPTTPTAGIGVDLPEVLLEKEPRSAPSLRRNFTARFFADTYGLLTSLIAASVSARMLGPSGRGYYASLVLLSVLFAQLFGAGLGEAAIVLPGSGRASHKTAFSATLAVIIPLGFLGAITCIVTGAVALDPGSSDEWTALGLAGLLVLLNACSSTLAWFLISREKVVLVGAITVMSATVIVVSLCLFLSVLHLRASGAVLASVLGIVAILAALLWFVPRQGISLRPAWDGRYLRSAARFGLGIQISNLLVQMAGRIDLIIVYRIGGSAPAGMYSIALTLGALVGSVPVAIAYAAFPRLPKVTEDEARALTASLFRTGIAAAVSTSVALSVLAPFAIPVVFGPAYRGAIGPTLILVPAGVLWSGQWILCRAAAARALTRPLVLSFFVSFVIMILLDLILIPRFGVMGAAVGSFISSAAGFGTAVASLVRGGWPWRPFVPRAGDWLSMFAHVRQMLESMRRGDTPVQASSQ